MKPNQPKAFTRWQRFWFAIGALIFELNGVPVESRPLPEAPPASPKAARKAEPHENKGAEQYARH